MKISEMLFANAMMGEGGGGGGGGDLSTAQVTVIGDTGTFQMYCTMDGEMRTSMFRFGDEFLDYILAEDGESVTGTLYWVGNSAVLESFAVTSITGDAVYDAESRLVTVSGDCTIAGFIDD